MKFEETKLAGAFLVTPERHEDERGYFTRTWCRREFEEQGIDPEMVQCSLSHNAFRGTLRGMHYQAAPYEETKLVRCSRGAIYDVLLDLRPDSKTHLEWVAYELTAENGHALYVPPGLAHGFLTLAETADVFYQMGVFYQPGAGRGVRWNDEAFGIEWPKPPVVMSEQDRSWPLLADRSENGPSG